MNNPTSIPWLRFTIFVLFLLWVKMFFHEKQPKSSWEEVLPSWALILPALLTCSWCMQTHPPSRRISITADRCGVGPSMCTPGGDWEKGPSMTWFVFFWIPNRFVFQNPMHVCLSQWNAHHLQYARQLFVDSSFSADLQTASQVWSTSSAVLPSRASCKLASPRSHVNQELVRHSSCGKRKSQIKPEYVSVGWERQWIILAIGKRSEWINVTDTVLITYYPLY